MAALEAPKARVQRLGVMLVPPIERDIDKWETIAHQSQMALAEATREGIETRRKSDPSFKETVASERSHWPPGA
jgi:hypothetical protein